MTDQTAEFGPAAETEATAPVAVDEEGDTRSPDEIMAELLAKQGEDDAPAEQDQPEEADAEEAEPAEVAAKEGEETTEETAEVLGEAPEHYTKAEKATLAKIEDADTRQAVIDMRKGYERVAQAKFEEAAQVRREFEPIDQALAPFAADMQRSGLDRGQAVASVLAVWNGLKTNPAQGIAWIAENFGRSLAGTDQARAIVQQVSTALGVTPASGGKDAPANGETPPWAADVTAIRRELDGFKSAQQQAEHAARQRVISAADAELQEFAEAKTDDGVSKHPHYDAVRSTMGALMQAAIREGSSIDLETAYQRALRTRDDLPGAANGGPVRRPAAAMGKTVVARARQATTPATRSIAAAPRDAESDDRSPDVIMRELLGEGVGATH